MHSLSLRTKNLTFFLVDIGGYGVNNIIFWLYNNYDDIRVPFYRFHWLLRLLLVCQKDLWCRQGGLESLNTLTICDFLKLLPKDKIILSSLKTLKKPLQFKHNFSVSRSTVD